jgi:cysteine desulfurase
MGLRAGPENVPAWIGLGAAANLAARCSGEAGEKMAELSERLIKGILDTVSPSPTVLCQDTPRLPNTVLIEMPGSAQQIQKSARQLAFATAQSGTPADEMTRVLRAIGHSEARVGRAIRLSLGWTTSRESIDRAVDLLADAWDAVAPG